MNIPLIQQETKLDNKNRLFLPAKIYHALKSTTDNLFVILAKSPELNNEHYIKLIDQAILDTPRDPLIADSLAILKNKPVSTLSIDNQHRILLGKKELQRLFGGIQKEYGSVSLLCISLGDHIVLARKELGEILSK